MAIKDPEKHKVKMLHSLDAFGILKVSLSSIRIEKLQDRVKPKVAFPHKHDFFQIMLVTSGSGLHQIDFIKHRVSRAQIFLMKPGQMHSWKLSKGVKGYIIEFNLHSLSTIHDGPRLINDLLFSPDAYTFEKNSDFQESLRLSEMMMQEFQKGRELHDLCLQGYLTAFLVNIIRAYQHQLKPRKALTIIEEFKNLIEKNFKQCHSVEFYANELKTSPKALSMQMIRSTGKSPLKMIQERILLEAKRYLAFSHLSVSEIGYELGFDDANYFSRFFRQHEKKSPASFRKEALMNVK